MMQTLEPNSRVVTPVEQDRADREIADLDPTRRIGPPNSIVVGPRVSLDVLRELGPYRLLRQLGAGGMGIVFEAEDMATGELFAVKVLRPTLVMEPEAKQRFFREAQAMAAIGHQRIVPVIRVGEEYGIPYLSMPLLLGETLEQRLHRNPEFTVAEIIRIGIEIAEGLDAAHRHGLVHRDVKPANVWLEEPFGGVRLLDLGLAREITSESMLTHSGIVVGTPSYMSPEQAHGERLDGRSDLFGLGCILYQLATGFRPFDGSTPMLTLHQIASHHPARVSAIRPSVPAMLSNLIMELVAKNPDDRPASAAVVMERLRRVSTLEAKPAKAPAFISNSPKITSVDKIDRPHVASQPKSGMEFMASLIVLLLATVVGIWYLVQG
ncbi:MAG: serine/threonine protein kinase [Planctomycetes bacterium]|nr:serine/threonine protein kinase [Planctomycetota bacterium]